MFYPFFFFNQLLLLYPLTTLTHMRKKWLLLFLATILVTIQYDVNAQQQRKEKYRNKANDPVAKLPYYKKLRWADDLFKAGSYFNAIEYYTQLKQEQERNPYITYQLAESYWFTRDYVPAAHFYGEVFALAPKLYPEATYKEALMLKMQGEYDAAIRQFNKFITDNPKTYKKLKLRAKRQIEGCNMAMNSIKNPISVTIQNAGPNVNSAYTELSPMPLGDTALLFGTMRQNTPVNVDKSRREEYMSRMMVSRKQENIPIADSFQWALKFLDGQFNDPKVHVGNGVFSPGGDRFYFTKCAEEDSMKVICKIYISKFEGARWTDPVILGEGINESGSNTQPYVAKVGKKEVLFFSSNRKLQSRGGYDIWYSIIDPRNGTYRRPQNAGKQINTEGNEITPYYDSRINKLYFASDGWVTMGGFDIFSGDGGPSRYTNLSNLGYPINSPADELYFIKDPSGKPDAYVVSNRIGSIALKNPTCCDDIWRIQFEPKLMVIGKVLNRSTNQPVEGVVAKMVDDQGDLKTFDSPDGNFGFNMARGHTYVITGDKQGFSTTRATVNTSDVKRSDPDDTAYVTIYLDEITNEFAVRNVYFDYDKSDVRPESVASLDSLTAFMKDNGSLSVELYAFTDAKGTDAYNKDLSIRRGDAVKSYLVQAGVEDARMIVKPWGERMPAASNTTSEGQDNPMGRQLNRRVEFRIVTDVPTRRVIYNSAKPGSLDEQSKNLQIDENSNDESEGDQESESGNPGSRVNRR
jgi:outer membrane protein OmpA-like peptidoglycan-associated protein/tetratricopeptide (TPR) repeat protein